MSAKSVRSVQVPPVVAAIDFGTTCTGYAYWVRKEKGREHRNYIRDTNILRGTYKANCIIYGTPLVDWSEAGTDAGFQVPTTVLMDIDKKFHSFGFKAEAKYKMLTLKQEHKGWYYFRHFKMNLHHEKDISRNIILKTEDGKEMGALLIFTEAIKEIKSQLLTKLKNASPDMNLDDIRWVLTVPAIWRHSAKQFMREAASKAGIRDDKLTLALEPASAAIFCKESALNKVQGVDGTFLRAFNPEEKYIVVDLGGGTVDTTGHEVTSEGKIKELHAATGGAWGGELVNKAFEEFILELVTARVLEKFRTTKTNYWIGLLKDFENKKCKFIGDEIEMEFPTDLIQFYKEETGENLHDNIKKSENKENIELIDHSLIIKKTLMDDFFNKPLVQIIHHLETLLSTKKMSSVKMLLLVGGFSESTIVSTRIREHFRKRDVRVLAPPSACSAILKGAVMFGIDPDIISSRISPYTYGVHTRKLYDVSKHPKARMTVLKDDRKVVNNAFDIHIVADENVYVSQKSKARSYNVTNRKVPDVYWNVYQSESKTPVFCDEARSQKIGRLHAIIPDSFRKDKVCLKVQMTCHGTELEASAIAEEGEKTYNCKVMLDFLETDQTVASDVVIESTQEN